MTCDPNAAGSLFALFSNFISLDKLLIRDGFSSRLEKDLLCSRSFTLLSGRELSNISGAVYDSLRPFSRPARSQRRGEWQSRTN